MPKLIPKNEATLRAVLKLVNATAQDIEDLLGPAARPAIKSLHDCGLLETVETARRATKVGHSRDMRVYAITEKGRQKLRDVDLPPVRQMKALKVPVKRPHPMCAVPDKHASVNVMTAEIKSHEVKITYGVNFEYEKYMPAPDRSRNYTPRPLRSITSMA